MWLVQEAMYSVFAITDVLPTRHLADVRVDCALPRSGDAACGGRRGGGGVEPISMTTSPIIRHFCHTDRPGINDDDPASHLGTRGRGFDKLNQRAVRSTSG